MTLTSDERVDPDLAGPARGEGRADTAFALAVACFGLFILVLGELTITDAFAEDLIGPRAFPRILGAFLLIGGAVLAVRGWRRRGPWLAAQDGGTSDEDGHPASPYRAFGLMAMTIVYAVAMIPLGFLIATPLYLFGAMWYLRVRARWALFVLTPVYTLLFFVVFVRVLRVPLPTGITTDFLRTIDFIR